MVRRPWAVMRDVVLPQCQTGLMTAFTLSFLISVGDYVTPRFVGGGAALMGTFIENQFSFGFNWPSGSAMAFTTMFATLILVRPDARNLAAGACAMTRAAPTDAIWIAIAVALAFYLVLPIVLVMLFSFNESALTSLPLTGLTFDWYRQALRAGLLPARLAEQPHHCGGGLHSLGRRPERLAALALARMPQDECHRAFSIFWPCP